MITRILSIAASCLALTLMNTACVRNGTSSPPTSRPEPTIERSRSSSQPTPSKQLTQPTNKEAVKTATPVTPTSAEVGPYKRATFAGGCFWCVQPPFDKLKGVIRTTVGYTGGVEKNPTYKQVAYGLTSHTEAIEVVYDPKVVSYQTLLEVFWTQIDPTVSDRQFVDVGMQYRAAIFYHNEEQRKQAEHSKSRIIQARCFSSPVVTPIVAATVFYAAEDYHQKFYTKSPYRYKMYRTGSGRDQFIQTYWARCKAFPK